MTKFRVHIGSVEIEANDPHEAALKTAETIALCQTIQIFEVEDQHGHRQRIELTPDEVDAVVDSAKLRLQKAGIPRR